MQEKPLQILADENIPLAAEAFGTLGEVHTGPGRTFTADEVRDADVLLVRSVTRVDEALLADSRVRFVGSATIGTDHVDADYLHEAGVAFAHAPGSNAESVVEYVLAALLRLAVRCGVALRNRTVGVVGCGSIGGRLARRLPALGVRVLKNDPPLAEWAEARSEPHDFVPLDTVLDEADAITLHVPLTRQGPHATHHLFGSAVLDRLRTDAWLLNASRGAVIDNAALLRVLERGGLGGVVLDVWENEPEPDPDLLRRVDLATPHVAGYSYDGKVQGTVMLYHAVADHFGRTPSWDVEAALAPAPEDRLSLAAPDPALPPTDWLDQLARCLYDVGADDRRLRTCLGRSPGAYGACFSELRRTYPRRRTFARHTLPRHQVPGPLCTTVADGIGVRLV